ncbi:EpsG family protein [Acinetobacter junii]|uniref:EpsG family protein n=1 Tax=Acinetobacter junii TaxID=40215 RepID=UPI0012D2DBD4|nr:EpsG family protein [Acinetobacter junii]
MGSVFFECLKVKIFKAIYYIFLVVLCVFIPVLRDSGIGTDTTTYLNALKLNYTVGGYIAYGFEPVFSLLLSFSNIFQNPTFYYFLFVSLFFNILMFLGIFKLSDNIPISLIAFFTITNFYIMQFNISRQAIAVAFFCFSLFYLKNEDYKKYYIISIISVLFHSSGIVLFIFPWVYKLYSRVNEVVFYFFASVVLLSVLFFYNFLFSFYITISGKGRLDTYLQAESSEMILYFLLSIVVFGLCFSCKKLLFDNDKFYGFMSFISFMVFIVFFSINFMGIPYEGPGRFILYFLTSYLFLFSKIFNSIKKYEIKIMFFMFFMFFSYVFSTYYLIQTNIHGVFPFYFE